MLEESLSASQRWGGASALIDNWLDERKKLIISYCALTGTNGYHEAEQNNESLESQLKKLCQMLMDYVSAGHFEIYEKLKQEVEALEETKEEILKTVEPVFEKIQQTTDACLAFNDTCEKENSIVALHDSLSVLGEILAERFEMEDKLIERMHGRYRDHALSE